MSALSFDWCNIEKIVHHITAFPPATQAVNQLGAMSLVVAKSHQALRVQLCDTLLVADVTRLPAPVSYDTHICHITIPMKGLYVSFHPNVAHIFR